MSDEREPGRRTSADEAALAWWVKCDAGPLSAQEQAELDAWLAADPAHRAALDGAERLFGEVRRLWAAGRPTARRRPLAAPATALLAASLAFWLFFDEIALRFRADALTAIGETRVVTLEDGSLAHLSARSAIAVHYRAGERRLTLLAGQAFFQAAPDSSRPFVVEAAGATVTALGTAFDIALRDATHADVAVIEHKVAVTNEAARSVVEEGRRMSFGAGTPIAEPEPADLFKVGGWRRGRLIFEDEPLESVLATLARYRSGLTLAAPAARRLRVTGTFDAANPEGAIRALKASLGLKALSIGSYVIYIYK
ncbi:FecR domain-containing protein [Methylosinus sp. Sm6]|uniref:FecR family protein n=1 Tax=Methylosinus sp. Sm6 TaxID=2866948 RepID=UPI001C995858|nr:FecR domain-containing protein [Methylosinus sp. Sm6]MBY6240323.1 FecR domain-containing protein [Methylosinus sp. Sm6]